MFRQDRRGATMVSYGLLVGLIALTFLAVLSSTGQQINALMAGVGEELTLVSSTGEAVAEDTISPPPEDDCTDGSIGEPYLSILNDWYAVRGTYTATVWCGVRILYLMNGDYTPMPYEAAVLRDTVTTAFFHNNGASLSVVPEALRYFTALETVTLSYNALQTAPAWLADLPNLTTLQINHNASLTTLPTEICQWGEEVGHTLVADTGVCP